jgi:hypothetical protein
MRNCQRKFPSDLLIQAPRPHMRLFEELRCAMRKITRSYRIRTYPNGAQRRFRAADCLTQCLRDQDSAFRNFFAGQPNTLKG